MTTYRIVERKKNSADTIRFDLPEFKTSQEAHDFVQFELMDWNEINMYVTPIEATM